MISLKQLKYALAVEAHLHFRKAAEACSVSQSALSKAKSISLQMEDLMKVSEVQKSVLSYPMSIGIIPTICPFILPIVFPALREQYPEFEMNVVEEQSHLTFEFWHEDFYWVTHEDEVTPNVTEVASKDIEQSRLMLLKDGHCLKDHAITACKSNENVSQGLSATSLNTLIQLVIGKTGTTLIPEMALNQLIQNNSPLRTMHLSEKGPHRSIAFVVRPNYAGLKNIEALIALFKAELETQVKQS